MKAAVALPVLTQLLKLENLEDNFGIGLKDLVEI